ncbi:energy transducer TonB, partial [Cognatilysobacter lacus]
SPDYPSRALREGARGTVLVLVHIGPDGVPTATEIAQSSGSRELDRAATEAVRRWRFEPAMSDGHPTVGDVVVPIDFSLAD